MKCIIALLVFSCAFLMPAVSQAIGDPVLAFSFDNVEGDTVEDLSEFGNDGTLQNKPKAVDGKFGKALEFQVSRVVVPASDSLSSELFSEGRFTLSLWISAKLTGSVSFWQQVFRAGPDPNDTLFINDDGRLSWRGWVGGAWAGGICETVPGLVAAETWTHVAVVSDAANFRIYINGQLSKETPFQQTRGNNSEYVIGGYAGEEVYNGAVDDLAVFPEPLPQSDILSIMEKGVIGFTTAVEPGSKLTTTWGKVKFH